MEIKTATKFWNILLYEIHYIIELFMCEKRGIGSGRKITQHMSLENFTQTVVRL